MKSKSQYSRYFTYIRPFTKLPIVRTYGSATFTLVVMTIFIFYAIKPTVETILVLQKKLEDSTQVLEKVNQKANNLLTVLYLLRQYKFVLIFLYSAIYCFYFSTLSLLANREKQSK